MTFDEYREQWAGVVAGKRGVDVELQMEAVLEFQSEGRGGSLPFKGLASDGEVYWIKQVANRQSGRVPVTEQLIAGLGRLIDAPVCETSLIRISDDFDGEVLENGTALAAGIAHASRDIAACVFDKWYKPRYRTHDDNRRRHAGYFALYDWCWGDDMQWLYDLQDDRSTYSHDHGHFLPDGPAWTADTLAAAADLAHELDAEPAGLDDNELLRIAGRLESITRHELAQVIHRVPPEWPTSDQELEVVGAFIDFRRCPVANRLRTLAERIRIGP